MPPAHHDLPHALPTQPTRRSRALRAVAVIGMAVGALAGGAWWWLDSLARCANTPVATMASPNGQHQAVVFVRDCGATTAYATHVAILQAGQRLPANPGSVFVADAGHGAARPDAHGAIWTQAHWRSAKQLHIAYDGAARVFRAEGRHAHIALSYQPHDRTAAPR